MRLFSQLDEQTQILVLQYCASIVLQDIIDGTLEIEPVSDEDTALKQKIIDAHKQIEKMTEEEKAKHMISIPEVATAVQEFALEYAKSSWYHDSSESVICTDLLEEEMNEALELEEKAKPKKGKHTVN